MAGFVCKHNSYLYTGELTNATGAELENGMLVVIDGATVKLPTADATTKFTAVNETTLMDSNHDDYLASGDVKHAYRFRVDALGKPVYMVVNEIEYNNVDAYNTSEYKIPVGAQVKIHPLTVGEEVIVDTTTGTITIGTSYGVLATGMIG